jgi:hypothetical protein
MENIKPNTYYSYVCWNHPNLTLSVTYTTHICMCITCINEYFVFCFINSSSIVDIPIIKSVPYTSFSKIVLPQFALVTPNQTRYLYITTRCTIYVHADMLHVTVYYKCHYADGRLRSYMRRHKSTNNNGDLNRLHNRSEEISIYCPRVNCSCMVCTPVTFIWNTDEWRLSKSREENENKIVRHSEKLHQSDMADGTRVTFRACIICDASRRELSMWKHA